MVASDVRDMSETGSYRGILYRTTSAGFGVNFNPNAVGVTAVGEVELNFASPPYGAGDAHGFSAKIPE